ncbi:hypothetical protein CYMTET_52382 [Cymbomonas tetramitiformis]|uniref:Uncharacterized protein n=1 Tax=Cymbomonas tetramitiformis TaxID=36881 RepID=A0AAE0EQU9_9CHLO|nr:hypothetical protein CYMTET_52382 [Cymbomonas tetramitiformis]
MENISRGWAMATMVAPRWPGQPWYRELEALASEVVFMPRRRDLFTPSRLRGSKSLGPSGWDAVMVRIPPAAREHPLVWGGAGHGLCWRLATMWACGLEVYRKDGDAWCPGSITGVSGDMCHTTYDDGDEEDLDLGQETCRTPIMRGTTEAPEEWDSALGSRWRSHLQEHRLSSQPCRPA